MLPNQKIRDYAKSKGVKLWEIAEAYNISDGNFSRKLRKEFTKEDRVKCLKIIDSISSRK